MSVLESSLRFKESRHNVSQFISVAGYLIMNHRNGNVPNQSELAPPRFDEHAHLKAQPVMPITKSRIRLLFEKFSADSSRSLALIVILGLLTGALIGVSLVRQNTSGPEATDQALVVEPEKETLQLQDAEVGVNGIQTERTNIRSGVSSRERAPNIREPRAYRFAVIR